MRKIEPEGIYTREDFRELLQISRDKELELRDQGNYPRTFELGSRTIRIRGQAILDWLDEQPTSNGGRATA